MRNVPQFLNRTFVWVYLRSSILHIVQAFGKIIFLIKPFNLLLQNTKDNPPCNTLFIGNLGETVVEEELRGLFCL